MVSDSLWLCFCLLIYRAICREHAQLSMAKTQGWNGTGTSALLHLAKLLQSASNFQSQLQTLCPQRAYWL
ncbi:hypothetical protein MHYP_G00171660 [Metynnis hypsauchen]